MRQSNKRRLSACRSSRFVSQFSLILSLSLSRSTTKMEVAVPSRNLDFDFKSAASSPPSTPKRIGEYYFSAPTTPSHDFYPHFHPYFLAPTNHSAGYDVASGDFAFDLSQDWETPAGSADELFDGGVIKSLKPPPARISLNAASPRRNNTAPRNLIHKNMKETDPFAASTGEAAPVVGTQRGRERGLQLPNSSSRRAARSLSPLRDTQYTWEEETEQPAPPPHNHKNPIACSALTSASVKGHKKWRLKDLFLFRSASEGRAADKDPLKKHTAAMRLQSSFQAIEGPGSRRRAPVSAHELHYTVNRAVSVDLKKKTFLPYKQGIIGLLAFNPAVHAVANGFGLSRK